jgi:hypothetical protein
MTRTLSAVLFVALITFSYKNVQAATYIAATCNELDVHSVITIEQASAVDGDVIVIPADTCTWTATLIP